MPKTEKEILLAYVKKNHNLQDAEVTPLIYEGDEIKETAIDALLALDAEKVRKLKEAQTEKFNEGHKKGKGEALAQFEKSVREKYELTTDKTGTDLIDEILSVKSTKPKISDFTPDELKKHPAFLNLESELTKKHREELEAKENEVKQIKQGFEKDKKMSIVERFTLEKLSGMKPVLEDDEKIASKRKQNFVAEFKIYDDFEIINDTDIYPLKDGKRVEDKVGNAIKLDQLIAEKAPEHFKFMLQDDKGNAGNGGKKKVDYTEDSASKKKTFKLPDTQEKFREMYAELMQTDKQLAAEFASQWHANKK